MRNLVPAKVFLTKGVGRHKYQLKSFEEALRKAGVAQQNLVQVSSILPPRCKLISREKGLALPDQTRLVVCVQHGTGFYLHAGLYLSFWPFRPGRFLYQPQLQLVMGAIVA